ncbi:MAG: (2E,6E)-farnesyl diphosphate synthase [Gammaproteobacteria bacterium]|nr:MAG: (2E,6E)-farnesyl diphosphate synthase [Gammaproteobacteria bacterium]
MTDLLTRYRERAERALDARLPPAATAPARLHEAMRYATLGGGKRVRACLVYAAGAALGAREEALDAPACAVELIHAYSLVHDDLPCMDDDDLRRGKPTCHKAYDEATALLVGDSLQTLAFELLAHDASLAVSPARRLEMITVLARATGSSGMAGGQAIDLASVGKKLVLNELQDMHARKTGALIRAAVQLGALAVEHADKNLIAALDHYAESVGLAFQIADDVLDVEGETGVLGKRAGADKARGKPTYATLLGPDGARTKAKALLDRALESLGPLGDNGVTLAQLARYIVERRQ